MLQSAAFWSRHLKVLTINRIYSTNFQSPSQVVFILVLIHGMWFLGEKCLNILVATQ